MHHQRPVWILLALMAGTLGCNTPSTPSELPPPPATLTITCPASISLNSLDGAPVTATFAPPTLAGGTGTLTSACTPASGTPFPVGSTAVACTARDSAAPPQTASCGFGVEVVRVPQLRAARILAYGDSITAGASAACNRLTADQVTPESWEILRFAVALDLPGSYPSRLQTMLRTRYFAQDILVVNEGVPGERTEEGLTRIRGVLSTVRPDVVLLQEGANDINQNVSRSAIQFGLRDMIRRSRESGVTHVFVGTLLPRRPGGCRAGSYERIESTNELIRPMVAAEGAVLVDLFSGFSPSVDIGEDGLHPSEAGYEKIANGFFEALRARLE